MPLIAEMHGVRGSDTGFPVQLFRDDETGRIVVRAINEGGYACTDVDLLDLISWLQSAIPEGLTVDAVTGAIGVRERSV